MNGVWSIEYGVSGLVPFQVAGGGPGWQVAGGVVLKGGPDRMLGGFIFRSQVSAVRYQVQVFRFGYRSREFHFPTAIR